MLNPANHHRQQQKGTEPQIGADHISCEDSAIKLFVVLRALEYFPQDEE